MLKLAEALFWFCAAGRAYIYVGYPVLIALLARLRPAPVKRTPFAGRVSVVISVHNEAAALREKLAALLSSRDAPLVGEVLVGSDGSTDDVAAAIGPLGDSRVRITQFPERRGKPSVVNELVPRCAHGSVVMMDARQVLADGALARLLEGFADERVGVISGELVLRGGEGAAAEGIGFYWNYEKRIRGSEAAFRSVPGATGAFYAIRKELFRPIPADTLLDDVAIPMQAVEQGYRCIFEAGAVVYDQPSESLEIEGIRKRRTIAGNAQLMRLYPGWLLPWRNPVWLEFVSHKLLRLASPALLAMCAVSNACLWREGFYGVPLAAQVLFYLLSAGGWFLARGGRRVRALGIPYLFVALNATTALALADALRGRYRVQWQKVV